MSEKISLKPYGSYITRLLTPFSDVDLSVQHSYEIDE